MREFRIIYRLKSYPRLFWITPQEEGLFNLINPSHPLTKIFIFTLLCDASSFYEGLKDLRKTLWSATKKCNNIIICGDVENQAILELILCYSVSKCKQTQKQDSKTVYGSTFFVR